MKILDLLEVNMKPTFLKGFLESDFAKSCNIGFEFELIVPGLEDLVGHNSGPDYSKDKKFPTDSEWKRTVYFWLTGSKNHSAIHWISTQINNFDNDFRIWQNLEVNRFLTTKKGMSKLISEINAIRKLDYTDSEENVTTDIKNQTTIYMQARDRVKNDFLKKDGGFKEFLKIKEINTMKDFCDSQALKFPYLHEYKKTTTLAKLSTDFTKETKLPSTYNKIHGREPRTPKLWIFEPDESIKDPEIKGAGAELVSPPMPLPQGLATMDQIWNWCKGRNITTNESTGLHIGISIPNHLTATIDYIKLILFLGDTHILTLFGRETNEYCVSILQKMTKNLDERIDIDEFLKLIRSGINNIAKSIFNKKKLNFYKEKYVTVNINRNYIEFRSMGGDYLNKKDLVLSTIGRIILTMSIASDPTAEVNEYSKKLYKFTRTAILDEPDAINNIFIEFVAGHITKKQMLKALRQRNSLRKNRNYFKNKGNSV